MNLNSSQNIAMTFGYYLLILVIAWIFAYFKKDYRLNITYVFKNILILYKNFFNWNISKIIINIYSFLAWIWLSLIFLIISFFIISSLFSKFDPNAVQSLIQTWVLNASIIATFIQNIWLILALIFCILIIFTFFIFTFGYGDILLQNVYKKYLLEEKNYLSKNLYFSYKHMKKFLWIITWIWAYLLIPLWILLIYFLILFLLTYFWIISPALWNFWSITLGITSIIIVSAAFIYFIYLSLRLSFSYISLVFSDNLEINSKDFTSESLKLSKWNVWKIIFIYAPFLALNLMIWEIINSLNSNTQILNYLLMFINFLILSWINQMVFISIYMILKKAPSMSKKLI